MLQSRELWWGDVSREHVRGPQIAGWKSRYYKCLLCFFVLYGACSGIRLVQVQVSIRYVATVFDLEPF